MITAQWLRPDVTYMKQLAGAGVEGVTSVWNGPHARAIGSSGTNGVWLTTAVGGVLGALLARNRKHGYPTALGVLVGAAGGFGGSVAWKSRGLTTAIGRSVAVKVNAVRDEHWLKNNPIDYA